MKTSSLLATALIFSLPGLMRAQALNAAAANSSTKSTADLARFERRAVLSKELGATHVAITEDLPPALWQFNPPDDPYPAWFVYRVSLLKVFAPKAVQPFVDLAYAGRIARILEERCAVLRRLGLKAHWNSNEPQVLPEAFFQAHPRLRGPRVDHPNRSRVAWFAPCVDQPETLRLYREAVQNLLARCPEVESFNFLTQDSGSGFCWVPALYPGINGPGDCKDRPMEQRVAGFLINLQQAAREAGHDVVINLTPIAPRQWMIPSFSPEVRAAILKALPRGIALEGREGPDGRAFGVTGRGGVAGAFYPVIGLPVPALGGGRGSREGQEDLPPAQTEGAGPGAGIHPVLFNLGDDTVEDFNVRLLRATRGKPMRTLLERLTTLRTFAGTLAGEDQADNLLEAWVSLDEAQRRLEALDFGGMLRFGHVLNRWITRPMVPFPEELTADEKKHFRPFLFQARGEEEADDLVDIQAMRMYEGWGAKLLFQRVIETTVPQVNGALRRIARLRDAARDQPAHGNWELMGKRLEALICLLQSADHMVAYQAHLDRVRALGLEPEENPPLGAQSDWARTDMMELARREIDTCVRLQGLIAGTGEPLLDTAPTPAEETIMRLGPDLPAQLQRKIDIMNAHWRDYDRIFTRPNP